jgi:hypothetical protein
MAANYVLLEKITVGAAGAATVTFSGIPQTGYTDLVVRLSPRTDYAAPQDNCSISFNGSTANFSQRFLSGDGTSASSFSRTDELNMFIATSATGTANTFSNIEFYIPNYTSANYKSFSIDDVEETNSSAAYAQLHAGLWSNTAAITSISFAPQNSAKFVQYSTFYLYGVAALGTTPVIVPYATGGDTIMTDGSYWYHAFKASGTFTPLKGLSCDVLVVAGGASGGSSIGGGGGAGGYRTGTALSISTAQTVTIGAGGTAPAAGGGGSGTDSTFSTITSTGGGGGGGDGSPTGPSNGGSGGGARAGLTAIGTGNTPSTSPSQGNSGGIGAGTNPFGAGGGGGAGAVGGAGATAGGGNGGVGLNTLTAWFSATGTGVSGYVAGGGGGGNYNGGTYGSGGSGGGGAAGAGGGTAATANTGGGGGGCGNGATLGGAGGSGLTIVRYAV